MNYKNIELVTHHPYPDENGKPIPVAIPFFRVENEHGELVNIPFEVNNRHYIEFKEWFDKQKKKPFDWPKKEHITNIKT